MFTSRTHAGVTTYDITPDGIKILAAFAACIARGGAPAAYAENLTLMEAVATLTDGEISDLIRDRAAAYRSGEAEAAYLDS